MIRISLPDVTTLRLARERGALALLDAALVVAEQALRLEHPTLDELEAPEYFAPPSLMIGHLLIRRLIELRDLLAYYDHTVRLATTGDDFGNMPF